MKIDGYEPADPEVAIEIGVELEFETEFGSFNFRAKSTGRDNVGFKIASEKLANIRAVREKTGFKQDTTAGLKETLAIWYDHVILNWATTVKSDGKPVKNTRDNFLEVLAMAPFVAVFIELTKECENESNFVKQAEAEAVKN